MGRCWRLADRLAGPAGELLTDMLDDFPLSRDHLQHLGHVLADFAQGFAAAAGTHRWAGIDDAFARQVFRQGPARRFAPLERNHRNLFPRRRRCCDLGRRLALRCGLFQIGEVQFKLIQQRAAFGGLSVSLVTQPCDLELHLLDMERQRMGLCFGIRRPDPFGNDQRLQRLDIIGKRIDDLRHDAMESQNADVLEPQPATRVTMPHSTVDRINRPLGAARCAAARANRSLPTDSPAAPA